MKTRTVLSVAMAIVLLLTPGAFAERAGQGHGSLARFQGELKQDGFDVSPGKADVWNMVAEWCAYTPGVDSAWYFNNQPYLQFKVPQAAKSEQLNAVFQMREDEAVVVIGQTPPPARYFSYTPFLSSRVYPDGRRQILATLGDSLNNATIKTIGDTPFNAPVVLIFTPDQGTDARVRWALHRAGYPAAIINTIVFPASMLKLGYGDAADELRIVPRAAIWQDQAAGDAYMKNPPFTVFRVTPRTQATAKPFANPPLRIRGTGHTEMDLMNKLGELRQGIIDANPGMAVTDVMAIPTLYEGFDYIQRGENPFGDGRDCFYVGVGYAPEMGVTEPVTLADDEFLVIYGPNHVATGKATYMNINVYSGAEGKVPLGSLDDRDFPDSAAPYLPGDQAADLMFAYKVSRSCRENEPGCLPLKAPCSRLTVDASTLLGIGIRTYLEPATKVGPVMPEMLYDRVMKFSPRR